MKERDGEREIDRVKPWEMRRIGQGVCEATTGGYIRRWAWTIKGWMNEGLHGLKTGNMRWTGEVTRGRWMRGTGK
jgi:hypothetical protein